MSTLHYEPADTITPGDRVIVRGGTDDAFEAGTFVGVNEYGHAIIEVTIHMRHNGVIIGTDVYRVTRYLNRVSHA